MNTSTTSVKRFFASYAQKIILKGSLVLEPDELRLPPISYLEEGLVTQYDITPSGSKAIVNIYKPGAFFPASSAINKTKNKYYFEASADSKIRQSSAKDLEAFLITHPEETYELLQRLYRGLDGLLGRIVMLLGSNANSRLLYELAVYGDRFGKNTAEGLVLEVTENELAQQSGLARETISRELKQLKKAGVLSGSRGRIVLYSQE